MDAFIIHLSVVKYIPRSLFCVFFKYVICYRTLYVTIAILICLLIGGMLMFFLLPRSVSLDITTDTLNPINIVVNQSEQYVFLTIRVSYSSTPVILRI